MIFWWHPALSPPHPPRGDASACPCPPGGWLGAPAPAAPPTPPRPTPPPSKGGRGPWPGVAGASLRHAPPAPSAAVASHCRGAPPRAAPDHGAPPPADWSAPAPPPTPTARGPHGRPRRAPAAPHTLRATWGAARRGSRGPPAPAPWSGAPRHARAAGGWAGGRAARRRRGLGARGRRPAPSPAPSASPPPTTREGRRRGAARSVQRAPQRPRLQVGGAESIGAFFRSRPQQSAGRGPCPRQERPRGRAGPRAASWCIDLGAAGRTPTPATPQRGRRGAGSAVWAARAAPRTRAARPLGSTPRRPLLTAPRPPHRAPRAAPPSCRPRGARARARAPDQQQQPAMQTQRLTGGRPAARGAARAGAGRAAGRRAVAPVRATAGGAAGATAAGAEAEPLLVRAARGEAVDRAPCWMMRQAGRWAERAAPGRLEGGGRGARPARRAASNGHCLQ
jgi:hypothetical protein